MTLAQAQEHIAIESPGWIILDLDPVVHLLSRRNDRWLLIEAINTQRVVTQVTLADLLPVVAVAPPA